MREILNMEVPLQRLDEVARAVAEKLGSDAVIFLRGDLAAGKTTLVKALAKVKGHEDAVTSPTFSIQQIYGDDLYHYDLYQCPNEKFAAMGLLEGLEAPGWHLIEWGDDALLRLLKSYGFSPYLLTIEPTEEGRRYRMVQNA